MTTQRISIATLLISCLLMTVAPRAFAQSQPLPASAATAQAATSEPIGNVVTLTGNATVTRGNATTPLKLKDDIFRNDMLQTAANATLGVTFNDATTFNLTSNARIAVDNYIYDDGGRSNAAIFNIIKGTVAFAAAAVAKTGDMKISTPSATLGIRGTTGLVDVPDGAAARAPGAAAPGDVAIKLYPDADGKVGRIEVNGRDGARLGSLSQGASGFAIRPGAGDRYTALPLQISPQQAARDQGIVRQVHAAQTVGRRIVTQQRELRRANPNRATPARPDPARQTRSNQPALQRPGAPNRPASQRRLPAAPKVKLQKPKR